MVTKSERIEVRLSAEHKALIERAARTKGQSLSAFVVSALLESARQAELTVLTRRDWERFLEIMDREEEPAEALVAAARKRDGSAGAADVEIARLRKEHIRSGFDSSVPALDAFLQRHARQNDEKGLSRTYVVTRAGGLDVLGYVTVRVGQVACADLPPEESKGLPRYPVPVLHVARLAVDRRARGMGLGERLLLHALRKAGELAAEVGVWGVEVIAKDEAARSFYARYGFRPLVDDGLHLYLSLKTLRKAFG